MKYPLCFVIALTAWLVSLPAAAEPEPEELFTPAVYFGFSFGGASGAQAPRAGLRLDAARMPGGVDAPALMQWELRPGRTELAVAGQTLLASGDPAAGYAEGEGGENKATSVVAVSLLGTAAVIGVAAWALDDVFDDGFGDEVAEAMVEEAFNPENYDDGEGESDPPACTGVEVGEECIGGG